MLFERVGRLGRETCKGWSLDQMQTTALSRDRRADYMRAAVRIMLHTK